MPTAHGSCRRHWRRAWRRVGEELGEELAKSLAKSLPEEEEDEEEKEEANSSDKKLSPGRWGIKVAIQPSISKSSRIAHTKDMRHNMRIYFASR